jgi:hypothetical protein
MYSGMLDRTLAENGAISLGFDGEHGSGSAVVGD